MDLNEVEDIMETLDGHSDARIDSDKIRELCQHILHLDELIMDKMHDIAHLEDRLKKSMEATTNANKDVKLLSDDCYRLRAELDEANGVIR